MIMFVYVMFVCIHAFNMAVHFRRPLFTADYGIKKYLKKMAFLTFFLSFLFKNWRFFYRFGIFLEILLWWKTQTRQIQ